MKRRKRVAIMMGMAICTLLVALAGSAFAATITVTTGSSTAYFDEYNGSNWADQLTPSHTTSDGKVAYCLAEKKASPGGNNYTTTDILSSYPATVLKGLRIILETGYPLGPSVSGLTSDQMRYATANAIRFWLAESGYAPEFFYNNENFENYSNAQLRTMAADGQIGSKMRAAKDAYIPVLRYCIELLITARSQKDIQHDIIFSPSTLTLSFDGTYFIGTTTVTSNNNEGGYTLDKSGFPAGTAISGFTGNTGDVLTIKIPATVDTSDSSMTLIAAGFDDAVDENVYAYAPTSSSYQPVAIAAAGDPYMVQAGSGSIQIKTPAVADLTVTSLSADSPSYDTNDTVTITATVKNQGTAAANSAVIRLTNSPSISTQNKTITLAAGASTTVTYTLTAPLYSSNTSVSLTATADPSDTINELIETNNTRSTSITILSAKPDLIVSALTADTSSYDGGDVITVTATVKNQGYADAAASTLKLAYGTSSTTKAVGAIADGATATVSLTITAPVYSSNTSLTLTATADSTGVITELNESNNTRSTSVTVLAAKPDLIVSALTTDSSTYDGGDIITITATIKNQGYADAAASTLKLAYGTSSTTKAVGAIADGATATVTLTITAPVYSSTTVLTLTATADSASAIAELDETNNTRSTTVTILAAKPDLIVSALSTDAGTYDGGDTITVTCTVKNQGYAAAAASTLKLAYGTSSTTTAVGSLAVGASTMVTLMITAPIYSVNTVLTLTATADSGSVITELDESNNTRSTAVTVLAAKADLAITTLTTDKSIYDSNQTITVTATVRNQGYATVSNAVIRLTSSPVTSTQDKTATLSAGATTTVTYTITAPVYAVVTTMTLTAAADPANAIAELDETNNTATKIITINAGLPDLTITAMTADKGAYESGDTVTISVTVKNQGYTTASGFVTRLSASPAITPQDKTCTVIAGSTTTLTYTFTAPTYITATAMTLTATADATGIVAELSETNNTKTASITINALRPDLTVVSANTTDWYAGMEVLVSAKVSNLSSQPVPSIVVRLTAGSMTVNDTIPVPGDGTNLAVFRFRVPSSPGAVNITIKADPDNLIGEVNENNNQLSKIQAVVAIPPSMFVDPDEPALESYFQQHNKTAPSLPATAASSSHSWQEIRLESGSYNIKTYWAMLSTTFAILPDPRVAQASKPGIMESGFGVTVAAKTSLTTNYDHPEKLIGPQMLWLFYPESAYGQAVQWPTLHENMTVQSSTSGSTSTITWQYPVNPVSVKGNRLHFTPLWFPDNAAYKTLAQAFYGWSPLGQMIDYATSSVTTQGDMYDRITVVRMR